MHKISKRFESEFKEAKVSYSKPSKRDGSSPISGYAVMTYTFGFGCSSQTIGPNGKLETAPTAYFAFATNTCFLSGDGSFMAQYYSTDSIGFIGINVYNNTACKSPVAYVVGVPIDICIGNQDESGYFFEAIQYHYFQGSSLPNIPVTSAQYATYM